MNTTSAPRATAAAAIDDSATRMLPIGETGKYINGVAFKPTDWADDGLPIVRIQNLTDRYKPMNRTKRKVDTAYLVQPGDLLVSWSATLDAFIWDREPALLNQHIFKVVPNTDLVSKKYLFFALRQAIVEMGRTEHLHGSTMKHINRGPFLAHRIRVPSLRVQADIVAELEKQFSRLDEGVANLKRVQANVRRYKDAVLMTAVQGKLVRQMAADSNRGRDQLSLIRKNREAVWMDHIGGRSTRRYRAPPAADAGIPFEIPANWAIATVEELTSGHRSCAYGVLQPGDDIVDGVPYIRVGDVHDGGVAIDTLKRIHPSVAARYPRTQLEGGELLITIVGTIGRTAVVPNTLSGANVARAIGVVPLTTMVNPRWVSLWFESPAIRLRMASAAHEVARKTLNLEDVRRAPVAVPPLCEQDEIVRAADEALSLVAKTGAELDAALLRARGLREAILAATFPLSQSIRK